MKVGLIALPWHRFFSPQAALGALSAYLRQHRPQHRVRCHYAYMSVWSAMEAAYEGIAVSPVAGEFVYLAGLYPEQRGACRERFQRAMERVGEGATEEGLARVFDRALEVTDAHLDELVQRCVRAGYELVGLSCSCAQLFGSLALARRLKAALPGATVGLGGAAVAHVGGSLLAGYPELDFVVEGEGETAFVDLLDRLERGQAALPLHYTPPLCEGAEPTRAAVVPPPMDLDALPAPQFDEYYERAEELQVLWEIPLEASRGCWWNAEPGRPDPTRGCTFCNLNLGPYRKKSAETVVSQMTTLSEQYENVRVRFVDNVLRRRGAEELCQRIAAEEKHFLFFVEVRPSVTPEELLALRRAGCVGLQLGVEGLSAGYLRRLNKGITPIQNLQAMRLAFELDLPATYNLLVGFPGATQDEVEETARTVLEVAIAYRPAAISSFTLEPGSTVDRLPGRFGLERTRSADVFAELLPGPLRHALELPWRDFDGGEPRADWTPVLQAQERWLELHRQMDAERRAGRVPRPLYYLDGGTFLEVVDRRDGFRLVTLEHIWRSVYLHCMRIRTVDQLVDRFARRCSAQALEEEILPGLAAERLIYREGERVLSLAVAWRADLAEKRIAAGR